MRKRRSGRRADSQVAKIGSPPGSLIHVGPAPNDATTIRVVSYDERDVQEQLCPVTELAEVISRDAGSSRVTWIDIDGNHDAAVVREVAESLELHPLTAEDIMNAAQRPKVEEFESYLYLAVKMAVHEHPDAETETRAGRQGVRLEHVSVIVTNQLVVSFQERPGDVFDPLRTRIRTARGQVRSRGADYLAYSLLDAVVDHYFIILEEISDLIEAAEERLMDGRDDTAHTDLQLVKHELIHLRRAAWPMRDAVGALRSDVSRVMTEPVLVYIRDVDDHMGQVLDLVETARELVSSLRDQYMTVISNRMNNVMRVLTVIGTVFLPLSFITGVYGMNLLGMPELTWRWAYPAVWGLMIVVAGGLLIYFRRRKWF